MRFTTIKSVHLIRAINQQTSQPFKTKLKNISDTNKTKSKKKSKKPTILSHALHSTPDHFHQNFPTKPTQNAHFHHHPTFWSSPRKPKLHVHVPASRGKLQFAHRPNGRMQALNCPLRCRLRFPKRVIHRRASCVNAGNSSTRPDTACIINGRGRVSFQKRRLTAA